MADGHKELLDFQRIGKRRPEEAKRYSKRAEDRQKAKITVDDVLTFRETGSMYDVDPNVFSEQMLGFLKLKTSGETANLGRNKFDNADSLNG